MSIEILCVVETPTGNSVVLMAEGAVFKTRVASPDTERAITREEAESWHRMAKSAGGCICRPFPRQGRAAS
jgi:hypothetical protein